MALDCAAASVSEIWNGPIPDNGQTVFGLLIVWISTGKGFFLHRERQGAFGAEGVSRVTTNAVVLASIAVLFADYLVSAVML